MSKCLFCLAYFCALHYTQKKCEPHTFMLCKLSNYMYRIKFKYFYYSQFNRNNVRRPFTIRQLLWTQGQNSSLFTFVP